MYEFVCVRLLTSSSISGGAPLSFHKGIFNPLAKLLQPMQDKQKAVRRALIHRQNWSTKIQLLTLRVMAF